MAVRETMKSSSVVSLFIAVAGLVGCGGGD
jgi:hypothetical protein